MIDFIKGTVTRVTDGSAVVDVGGIGLRVQTTPATGADLMAGEHCQLPTSLVVREDSWTLFGFATADERDVFETVQTVSGVGPRMAQALVGTLTPDGLRRAVQKQDATALMKVPGIGRKGAQRMLIELPDKLGAPTQESELPIEPTEGNAEEHWREPVLTGLVSLGWSAREAETAARAIEDRVIDLRTPDDQPDIAALLKAAMRELKR